MIQESITKSLVLENKRSAFLPRHCGPYFFAFENAVFDWMAALCEEYSGGYWHFYETSNGGFYMALDHAARMRVVVPSNDTGETMSAEAASIAANLFALNALCWKIEHNRELQSRFVDAYYALRDFALEHEEAPAILRVID